eukprot:scaffold10720_cov69-Phaeocystis_antarctica.AAC.6
MALDRPARLAIGCADFFNRATYLRERHRLLAAPTDPIDGHKDSRPASSSLRSIRAEVVFGSSNCKAREQRPAASCVGSRSPAQSSSRSTPLAASTNRSHVTVTEDEFAPPSHTTSSVLNVYSTRRSAPPIGGAVSYSTDRCVCAVLLRPRASAHVKLANTDAPSWIAILSDVSVATPLKPVSVVSSIRMGRSSAASSSSSCGTSPDGSAETTIVSSRSRPPCVVPSESFPNGATPVALCRHEKRTRRAGPALAVLASSTSTVTRTSGGEVSSSTGDPVALAQRAAGRSDVGEFDARRARDNASLGSVELIDQTRNDGDEAGLEVGILLARRLRLQKRPCIFDRARALLRVDGAREAQRKLVGLRQPRLVDWAPCAVGGKPRLADCQSSDEERRIGRCHGRGSAGAVDAAHLGSDDSPIGERSCVETPSCRLELQGRPSAE